MSSHIRPLVGIGVIVRKGDKILIGERLSNHGADTFQIPGGHLEFGETFESCAERETFEETGVSAKAVGCISLSNDIHYDKHYVSLGILADWIDGEPSSSEPEHSKNWQWIDPHQLPENIFPHSRRVIENWLSGTFYTL